MTFWQTRPEWHLLLQGRSDFLHLQVLFMHVPLHLYRLLASEKLACLAAA
jgi:hypothetical protein